MKINFVYKHLVHKAFNLVFQSRKKFHRKGMMTSQWLQKVPPYLRSRGWDFRMEAIKIQTGLDVQCTYGLREVSIIN